jgi:hypothetical protein
MYIREGYFWFSHLLFDKKQEEYDKMPGYQNGKREHARYSPLLETASLQRQHWQIGGDFIY